jgi:ATP-dependent exoDNAse (exonuclease V) beta subunit
VDPRVAPEFRGNGAADRGGAVAGRLVHRLFEVGADHADAGAIAELARTLLDPSERDEVAALDGVVEQAVTIYRRLRSRPEVAAIIDHSICFYEVPVSLRMDGAPGQVVRGVIDCLARTPGGEVVVLDFKTGVARETDRRQLDVYVEAARGLFPDRPVRGLLVYAD